MKRFIKNTGKKSKNNKKVTRKSKTSNNNGVTERTPAQRTRSGMERILKGDFHLFGSENMHKSGFWDCSVTGKEHEVEIYELAIRTDVHRMLDNAYKVYRENVQNEISSNFIMDCFLSNRGIRCGDEIHELSAEETKKIIASKSLWVQSLLMQGLLAESHAQLNARRLDGRG